MYKRIKELRIKNKLTQKDISKKLEISISTYSNYENGKTAVSVSILSKLAKIYNTSIDFIIEETDEITPYK